MLVSGTTAAGSVGLEQLRGDFVGSAVGARGGFRRSSGEVLAECFDSASEWSGAVRMSVSEDVEHFVCSAAETPCSVKFSKTAGGTSALVHKAIGLTDLQDTLVYVRFYVHEGGGSSSWDRLDRIYFTVADATYANFQMLLLADSSDITGPGWYERVVAPKMANMTAGTYADCWGQVERLRVQIYSFGADDTPEVSFDQVRFIPQLTKSVYAVTLDDGKASDYKYAAYLASKGICGTFYVIASRIGTNGYLSVEELRRMQQAGHLVANHSWSHRYLRDEGLSEAQFMREVVRAAAWLCDHGFADGARLLALPGGSSQWQEQYGPIYRGRWFEQLRLTDARHAVGFYDPTIQWADAFDDVSKADSQLQKLVSAGTVMVTGWHTANEGTAFTWEQWKSHIDQVAAKRAAGEIEVVTMAELLKVGG